MSLDATGKQRTYKRTVTYACSACGRDQMGVVHDLQGCFTLECLQCDAEYHVMLTQLRFEDQGTPQAEAALRVVNRVKETAAKAAAAKAATATAKVEAQNLPPVQPDEPYLGEGEVLDL